MWTGYEREGGARRGSNVKGVLGRPPPSGNRKVLEDLWSLESERGVNDMCNAQLEVTCRCYAKIRGERQTNGKFDLGAVKDARLHSLISSMDILRPSYPSLQPPTVFICNLISKPARYFDFNVLVRLSRTCLCFLQVEKPRHENEMSPVSRSWSPAI
ncbi:unnamed protein product [Nezara viridula]|uniref:Uncharacterized protein n=1 Tax=Nezara viridula TaxID=85310 RepID=A0A9P0H9K8_NEZVI|nr:unnamed protein product [Nezara viridula]